MQIIKKTTAKQSPSVAETIKPETDIDYWGDSLKEKILYLAFDVDKNSDELINEFYEDLKADYEFYDEQLSAIGINDATDLQTFLHKKGKTNLPTCQNQTSKAQAEMEL